jgi:hypothetical protein
LPQTRLIIYCIIANTCDTLNSNFSEVIVNCSAPLITNQPLITQTVFQGTTPADLMVTATGEGLSYQWYSNTMASTTGAISLNPAGTTATFTPSTITADTTYYYCIIANDCDTLNSDFTEVIVNVPITRMEVTVSPNPTEAFFNLKVKSPNNEIMEIRMFDMLGRIVQRLRGTPDQTFRLGDQVVSGMYIIEVRQAGQVETIKVVKQ